MSSPDTTEQAITEGDDASPPSRSSRRLKRLMLLLIGAPALWISYFWVVYLVAEVACVDQPVGVSIGETALTGFVVVSTVLAMVGVGAVLLRTRRSAGGANLDDGLRLSVILIVGCFVFAVLAVGLPALVLDPC